MTNDWQNALQSLIDGGNLPEGHVDSPTVPTTSGQKGKLTISFERKGRAGKSATIISGFTLSNDEVENIASKLKSKLGAGGSARGAEILIQGDRRADVERLLKQMGYKV